ncbi:MAG: hypothetical protein WAL67_14265 [Candidatus Cybelea sp.]
MPLFVRFDEMRLAQRGQTHLSKRRAKIGGDDALVSIERRRFETLCLVRHELIEEVGHGHARVCGVLAPRDAFHALGKK